MSWVGLQFVILVFSDHSFCNLAEEEIADYFTGIAFFAVVWLLVLCVSFPWRHLFGNGL